jgi:hypothetical protein
MRLQTTGLLLLFTVTCSVSTALSPNLQKKGEAAVIHVYTAYRWPLRAYIVQPRGGGGGVWSQTEKKKRTLSCTDTEFLATLYRIVFTVQDVSRQMSLQRQRFDLGTVKVEYAVVSVALWHIFLQERLWPVSIMTPMLHTHTSPTVNTT